MLRSLPVLLADDEIKILGETLARKDREKRNLEAEKKLNAQSFKDKIDTLDEDMRSLATTIRDGREYRPVECREEFNYERGIIEVMRVDTGEVVEQRRMTESERQGKLFEREQPSEQKEQTAEASEQPATDELHAEPVDDDEFEASKDTSLSTKKAGRKKKDSESVKPIRGYLPEGPIV